MTIAKPLTSDDLDGVVLLNFPIWKSLQKPPGAGWKTDWARDPEDRKRLAKYNCVAWTLGLTDRDVPLASDVTCEELIAIYGRQECPVENQFDDSRGADIACYGLKPSALHHVALRRVPAEPHPEFEWESKMGVHLRMIHRATDIALAPYVIQFYFKFKKRPTIPTFS
jgi:hypothetical protein